MGAASIDIYKAEREFHNLNFSDTNVIKWLIVYRDKVDVYYGAERDTHYNNAGNVKYVNQELIHIFAYLDELIKQCDFTQEQLKLIHFVSIGYTFKDIEEQSDRKNVKRRFEAICKVISQMNNELWSLWVTTVFLNEETKVCTKCKKALPQKEKFFGREGRTKDGFQASCKKCDNLRKKQRK